MFVLLLEHQPSVSGTTQGALHTLLQLGRHYVPYCMQEEKQAQRTQLLTEDNG